jgi:hypothetical protein
MAVKKNEVPAVEIEVQCCGKDECVECPFDVVEEVAEKTVEAPKLAGVYVAKNGDSYASIAAENAPKGIKRHVYALQLVEKNKGKALAAGVEVIL